MTDPEVPIDGDDVDEWFDEDDLSTDQVLPLPELDPAQKYRSSQLRVVRETKDYQLDYLQHALKPGRELIDISPAYQRRLRWPNKKKSLLIESFLLNIPVPPIYLFERDYNSYEVIDGRQRLDAISSFLANDFNLTGLEYWPELNKKRFLELPTVLKNGLLRRSLSAVVLLAETESAKDGDIDVRRVLFDRLNTGGIRLNPQELRNALYPGSFNALLIRLARSQIFTKAWGIPEYVPGEEKEPSEELLRNQLFSTMADAELVLRFFALRDAVEHDRQGSLRAILDRFMGRHTEIGGEESQNLEALFVSCLSTLISVFGEDAFRLTGERRGRLSRPLYDALMIAMSQHRADDVVKRSPQIRESLRSKLRDVDSYDILVGRGNTIAAVHDRVELAAHILQAGN